MLLRRSLCFVLLYDYVSTKIFKRERDSLAAEAYDVALQSPGEDGVYDAPATASTSVAVTAVTVVTILWRAVSLEGLHLLVQQIQDGHEELVCVLWRKRC